MSKESKHKWLKMMNLDAVHVPSKQDENNLERVTRTRTTLEQAVAALAQAMTQREIRRQAKRQEEQERRQQECKIEEQSHQEEHDGEVLRFQEECDRKTETSR